MLMRWELPPPWDTLALLLAIAVAVVYVAAWVRDVRHWCAVARAMMRGAYK